MKKKTKKKKVEGQEDSDASDIGSSEKKKKKKKKKKKSSAPKKSGRSKQGASGHTGGGVPGQFVASLTGVGKELLGGRQLFSDVNLSFLKGAKIGVLGSNGSGKSSLMKVLAGVDDEFVGERWHKPGITLGYLHQEPVLDPAKDVRGNVMDGVADDSTCSSALTNYRFQWANQDADIESLLTEQAALQSQIEDRDLWNLQPRRDCDASSALPPRGGICRQPFRRRGPAGRTVPPADPTT